MLVPQASLTRRPLRPSRTARAAWSWSNRSAVKRNVPNSLRSRPRPSTGGPSAGGHTGQGWRHPSVDVGEPVEATDRRKLPVDRRRSQAPLLHGGSVQLDVGTLGIEDRQTGVGCPLEEAPQVIAVGIEGPAAVSGQVGHCCHLGLIEERVLDDRGDRDRW